MHRYSGITEEKVRTAIDAERTRRMAWLDLVNRTLDPLIPTVDELSNRIGCPPTHVNVGIMDVKGQPREDGRPATIPCLCAIWHRVDSNGKQNKPVKIWLSEQRCIVELSFVHKSGTIDSTTFDTTLDAIRSGGVSLYVADLDD